MKRQFLTFLSLLTLLCFAVSGQLWAAGTKEKEDVPAGDTATSHYNKGTELMKKGEYSEARKELESALELKEDFAEAHNNLGYTLRKLGEKHYEAALEHYNRALSLNAELAEGYHYRGVLHVLLGEEDNAKKDLEMLNKLNRELGDELLQVIASGKEPEGHAGAAAKWDS